MASQIIKTGLIPVSPSANYKEKYRISDDTVGKFISLNGVRKFYNPGIGLSLSTPQSGSQTGTTTQIVSLRALMRPDVNSLYYSINMDTPIINDIHIQVYANFTINGHQVGGQSGSAPINITILAGSTFGSASQTYYYDQNNTIFSDIHPIIFNVDVTGWQLNGGDSSLATFTGTVRTTTSIPSNFTNPLNIPEINIQSINFYGASRDTLILKSNKLTS